MVAQTQSVKYLDLVEQLPSDARLLLHGVSWAEYEELLEALGESRGLRISYDEGALLLMTLSIEHENYVELIKRLIDRVSIHWRIKVLGFGSATLRRKNRLKGAEPDACFYVQNAAAIGNRLELDFNVDPPPDIVVEVDIHHESLSRFSIYAGLGVPELWHYDAPVLKIYHLREGSYHEETGSLALPRITGPVLTTFLARSGSEDQYDTLMAFEEWLQTSSF